MDGRSIKHVQIEQKKLDGTDSLKIIMMKNCWVICCCFPWSHRSNFEAKFTNFLESKIFLNESNPLYFIIIVISIWPVLIKAQASSNANLLFRYYCGFSYFLSSMSDGINFVFYINNDMRYLELEYVSVQTIASKLSFSELE